jgi:hypothetical protein
MLGPKAYTKALAPPGPSRFFLPNHKKFDINFLSEVLKAKIHITIPDFNW